MDCYNCGELGHLAHQYTKPKKDKFKNKNKGKKDDSSDEDEKKKDKPYKKRDGKKKDFHKKKKSGKAYIVGDWLMDIDSSVDHPMMIVTTRRWPLLLLTLHHLHRHHRHHPLHTYALWPRVNAR